MDVNIRISDTNGTSNVAIQNGAPANGLGGGLQPPCSRNDAIDAANSAIDPWTNTYLPGDPHYVDPSTYNFYQGDPNAPAWMTSAHMPNLTPGSTVDGYTVGPNGVINAGAATTGGADNSGGPLQAALQIIVQLLGSLLGAFGQGANGNGGGNLLQSFGGLSPWAASPGGFAGDSSTVDNGLRRIL